MATIEKSADFAIESKADSLLNRLSGKVADMVLEVAAHTTTNRTKTDMPLVTEGDIVNSVVALARALEEIEGKTDLPSQVRDALRHLRMMAQSLQAEPRDGKAAAPAPY